MEVVVEVEGVFFKMDENLNLDSYYILDKMGDVSFEPASRVPVSYYILDKMHLIGLDPASRASISYAQATMPMAQYFAVVGYTIRSVLPGFLCSTPFSSPLGFRVSLTNQPRSGWFP